MKLLIRFLVCMVGTVGMTAIANAASPHLPFDVVNYSLSVTLRFENSPDVGSPYRHLFSPLNTIEGEAVIVVENASDKPLDEISLVFNRLLNPGEIRLDQVLVEFHSALRGLEGRESLQILHVTVPMNKALAPGDRATLAVSYGGQILGYPEAGLLYTLETLDPDFTILRAETFSYPLVAWPSMESTRASVRGDAFDQKLQVTIPATHVAVNGGRLLRKSEDGVKAEYFFASEAPESAILIAIAPYELVTVGDHRIYHFADSTEGARNLTRLLGQAMNLLSGWFGPPPLNRGLVIAEIPEYFGSQAGPLIIQTSGAFQNPEQYGEFYHELSHLWNPIDIDPAPSRWNEGLAMFLQSILEAKLSDSSELDSSLQRMFEGLKKRLSSDELARTVPIIDYGKREMTDFSYSAGALLFGLLRELVGEQALLDFVASYSREHRQSGSRDVEFAAQLAAALGSDAAFLMDEWFLSSRFTERVMASQSWNDLRSGYVNAPGES